jgi:hypothetical protein
MNPEPDSRTRIVLSWLREDLHENAERVLLLALDEVDTTPQRRSWWPAWRTDRMNSLAKLIAAAAAVLAVAVIGYTTLPGLGIVGPGATPPPSPSLIARGTVVHRDWGPIEFEATREGPSLTGRMTIGSDEEPLSDPLGFLRVDLQCARTTEDGLVMIGGYITDGAGDRFTDFRAGTFAGLVLKPGSPVLMKVWAGNLPGTETTDCVAYLDAQLAWERATFWDIGWTGGGGAIELGP